MPPPLIMPQNGLWPSMIAAGGHQPSYQPPLLPAAPVTTPLSAGTGSDLTPTSAKTTTSRRKLTDEERRQMCLEAEQNPSMKQTQIGGAYLMCVTCSMLTNSAKFNVERRLVACCAISIKAEANLDSTVSKILRQKEKYMNLPPLEDVVSPGRKSKAKLPDFEKTLANWLRNQQKKGQPVSDDDLKKQARVFSFSRSDQAIVSSTSWLEKFKQKNRLGKYAEVAEQGVSSNGDASPTGSPDSSDDMKPRAYSVEALDTSAKEEHIDYFDFDIKSSIPEETGSHATISPASPCVPEYDDEMTDLPIDNAFHYAASNTIRQRSQTLPHLGDYSNGSSRPSTATINTKPPLSRALTMSLTAQSHVDPVLTMKRHKSVPDIHEEIDEAHFSHMQPPPVPAYSESASPVSHTASPAEDDNIKALHAIKKLLQENPGVADPDDYLAIGKLMEKMKLLRSPIPSTVSLGFDGNARKRHYVGIS